MAELNFTTIYSYIYLFKPGKGGKKKKCTLISFSLSLSF